MKEIPEANTYAVLIGCIKETIKKNQIGLPMAQSALIFFYFSLLQPIDGMKRQIRIFRWRNQ
jgi:hypothetical protein